MPSSKPTARHQNFCFTLNNYDAEAIELLKSCHEKYAKYTIFGREVGKSGTKHLQGYIQFRSRVSCANAQTRLPHGCHIEVARGGAGANIKYCSKEGDYEELGKRPVKEISKKSRDDLAKEFKEEATSGAIGVTKFAETNPGVWYFSGHNLRRNYLSVAVPVTRDDIHVEWVYGPPGVGKSRYAHGALPDAYIKDPRTKWWNGYMLETTCIIDDFGPGGIDINHLLRWFDRYKCLVEQKGDMCPLHVTRFIVTSNFSPEECFTDNFQVPHVQLPALRRRLAVTHMEG